jgi:hypothetical protein
MAIFWPIFELIGGFYGRNKKNPLNKPVSVLF